MNSNLNQLDPFTQKPLSLYLDQDELHMPYPLLGQKAKWCQALGLPQDFAIQTRIQTHKAQASIEKPTTIKNILAIYSTKGGVGKSTITHAMAKALANHGITVGVLDADIYGPNQADLFDDHQAPEVSEHQFIPRYHEGIHWLSMGNLAEGQPVIWRGPMASKVLKQLFLQTRWPALDYLLIDLPPGTGDIQLTLTKEIPVMSCCIITQPHPLAYSDALKGLSMMQKLGIHVGGWLNNMTHFLCEHCEHHHSLAEGEPPSELSNIAIKHAIPFLLPKDRPQLPEHLEPFLLGFLAELATQPVDRSGKIPKIVVK